MPCAQAKFSKNLQQLQKVTYSVLDVKETRWGDDFALFKDSLRDLEAMMMSATPPPPRAIHHAHLHGRAAT